MSSAVVSLIEKDSFRNTDEDYLITISTEAQGTIFQSPLTDSQPSACSDVNRLDIDAEVETPGSLVTDVDACDPLSPRLTKRPRLTSPSASTNRRTSWVWLHFEKTDRRGYTKCLLCSKIVFYSLSCSTNMLSHHIEYSHKIVYAEHVKGKALAHERERLEAEAKGCSTPDVVSLSSSCTVSSLPSSIQSFVVPAPNFENCLLCYVMKNYLPYCMCEDQEFRDLCYSLNRKCRTFSRAKLQCMFKEEYFIYLERYKKMLAGCYFAFTTDAWTSPAMHGYVTVTCHFIDRDTWTVYSLVLELFEQSGTATAIDCLESRMNLFALSYTNCIAVVTDTEQTMVAAG
jgi:hypothetical protein